MIDDTEIELEAEIRHPEPQPDYGKGLAWMMGFNGLMKLVLGAVGIFIARKVLRTEMGMFGLLANIYMFAEQMREAGLKQAYYNDNEITPTRFRTYARLSVISGVTFGAVLGGASVPLARFFGLPQLAWGVAWAALATFMNGLSVIPMAALQKVGRFRDAGLIETVANFTAAGVSLTMVLSGWGFEALVAQLVVRAAVQFGLAYWQKPYSVFRTDRKAAREIVKVCTPLVATDVLWLLYSLADQAAIEKVLGTVRTTAFATNASGLYQVGKRLVAIPGDFLFFPLFRTVHVALGNRSNDAANLGRTFMKSMCLCALVLIAAFGASGAMSRPLILALFTDKYAGTIPIFGIICLGDAFKVTGAFAGMALVAAGRSKIPLYSWLVPYPIAAIGILTTWSYSSLATIVWSYTAGMIAVNLVVIGAAFRYLEFEREQLGRFWKCLGIAATTIVAAYGISLIPLKPWYVVFVALGVIPLFHAMVTGTVFARNPLAYLSPSGVKRLRDTL
ncbi:MAG TPA: oligosaccharide flippase family protein [Fimbriimonadaceae bacterium]|nr:oligosaccharide flippase family protein [Fimbriimonadaceae bacterium]